MGTGNKLVIVESPTKAKKIGGYLGSGYTVMASVGHIRDLAQPSQIPADDKARFGKFGVDVDDGFKPYYIVDGDKKKTVAELKKALKNSDELYLATDEDREGEAIAWHLVQTLKPKVPIKRMVFHEITKDAIKASLGNTRNVTRTWWTRRRPAASSTASMATSCRPCCGARWARDCRPAASSPSPHA